jgi:hypothetical protein
MTNNNETNHVNEPLPPNEACIESQPQPSTIEGQPVTASTEVKKYIVPITANIQMTLTGCATVYAALKTEAISKVQVQIDTDTLDRDIEMEDFDSGYIMSTGDMSGYFSASIEIDESGVEVEDIDEVDPRDVLRADVRQLEAVITWDFANLSKRKLFLETLTEAQVAAECRSEGSLGGATLIASKDGHASVRAENGNNIPMSPDHERWEEFIGKLNGPEGCNFRLVVPDDNRSMTWTCDSTKSCPLARKILTEMGSSLAEIERSLAYFREHGGYCDCEIVLNCS